MAESPDANVVAAPRPCSPCRGTGTLISGAGGSPSEVPCPWCDGSGVWIPEHDAQEARRAAGDGAGEQRVSAEVD